MVDGFLGPWQTIVLAPRGGKIAGVFDEIRMINLNGNQEFEVPDILMHMTRSIYIIPFTKKSVLSATASTTNITLHLLAVHLFTTTGTGSKR